MPIHDWTRVTAGTWHDFHLAWISEIRNALNGGLLPPSYYAQAEQIAGPMGPDVLTLQAGGKGKPGPGTPAPSRRRDWQLATAPPRRDWPRRPEVDDYASRRRTMVIRHASGDRIVRPHRVVSPGNNSTRSAITSFVEKRSGPLAAAYHILVVDLFPPGPRDPQGIHGAIWAELEGHPSRCRRRTAHPRGLLRQPAEPRPDIEPTAVGRALIDMPLFLTPELYLTCRSKRRTRPRTAASRAPEGARA